MKIKHKNVMYFIYFHTENGYGNRMQKFSSGTPVPDFAEWIDEASKKANVKCIINCNIIEYE